MKTSHILTLALASLLTAGNLTAQVKLEPKFQEGRELKNELRIQTKQTLTIGGQDLDTVGDTRLTTMSRVASKTDEGRITLEESIQAMVAKASLPGGLSFNFDSENADQAASGALPAFLAEAYKAISTAKFSVVLGPDLKVRDVKILSPDLDALSPEARQVVQDQLSVDSIEKSMKQELGRLPDNPVQKGDSWVREDAMNLGAGQTMTFRNRYTYQGTEKQDGRELDKITVQSMSVEYKLEPSSAMPLVVKGSDLKVTESSGTLFFDRALGGFVSGESSVRIQGSMDFEINGMEQPGKLDLTMSTESDVTEVK